MDFNFLNALLLGRCDVQKKSFLVVGDWGGISFHPFTTPVQTAVADEMAALASRDGADFVVALGDNFYLNGVQDENDYRFKVIFNTSNIKDRGILSPLNKT